MALICGRVMRWGPCQDGADELVSKDSKQHKSVGPQMWPRPRIEFWDGFWYQVDYISVQRG